MTNISTPPQTPLKLHVGCGTNKLAGWVNIDSIKSLAPDLVHDIVAPLPFGDLTADEVLAEDLLEHFDKYMRFLVFLEWARVLKIGGIITVQVPNFKRLMLKFFKFGYNNFIDYLFGENMWRSEFYIGHFGNHKWAYTAKTLMDFVKLFGIKPLTFENRGLNIRLTGEKKHHVTTAELDKIQIYAHANATGIGKASLPLGFVREKIKIYQNNLETND